MLLSGNITGMQMGRLGPSSSSQYLPSGMITTSKSEAAANDASGVRIRLAVRPTNRGRTQHACQDTFTVRKGLRIGWPPRRRVQSSLKHGELLEKRVADAREPNVRYVARRSDHVGRAMEYWLSQPRQPRLTQHLIHGVDWLQ
jgi:hypothetical protein